MHSIGTRFSGYFWLVHQSAGEPLPRAFTLRLLIGEVSRKSNTLSETFQTSKSFTPTTTNNPTPSYTLPPAIFISHPYLLEHMTIPLLPLFSFPPLSTHTTNKPTYLSLAPMCAYLLAGFLSLPQGFYLLITLFALRWADWQSLQSKNQNLIG
jgi:hypothetical protein